MLHMYEDDFLQIQKKGENMKKKLVKKALVLCLAFSMLAGTLSVPAASVNDPSGFEVNSAAVKSENADIGESTEFVNDVQMRDQEEAAEARSEVMHVSAQFTEQNLSCGRQQVFCRFRRPKALRRHRRPALHRNRQHLILLKEQIAPLSLRKIRMLSM